MFAHAYTCARTLCMLLAVEGSFDSVLENMTSTKLPCASSFILYQSFHIACLFIYFPFSYDIPLFLFHGCFHRLELNSKDTDHLASPEAN